MKFKIGQMVLVDTVLGTVRAARIEAVDTAARRARVLYIDTGERQEDVRLGDVSLPREDADRMARERSRDSWRQVIDPQGGAHVADGHGGSVAQPALDRDELGI